MDQGEEGHREGYDGGECLDKITNDKRSRHECSNGNGELNQIEYWFVAPSSHPRLVTYIQLPKPIEVKITTAAN